MLVVYCYNCTLDGDAGGHVGDGVRAVLLELEKMVVEMAALALAVEMGDIV